MADQFSANDQSAEVEEYIDMDIRSTTIFCYHISSPNHKEFEFHLASNPPHKQTSISTADEHFDKGNLFSFEEEKLLKDSETMTTAGEIDIVSSIELESNKSWSKKLKGIGQSLVRFKISKAYFKSLITTKKEAEWSYRKSHNSVFLRNLTSKSVSATSLSSTSSSSFSSVSRISHTLKRSSSMSSEMERSVMGAIAYCKKSQ
ncbi:probable membrane-associated kinase regulator 4 [Dendrobium catenatum]|uniref:probable membrane-associated kinase regulator 4 n=1 Tax=Dendrobium catenatum TaxID=906689 RepID=UPI0009F3A891|nr:probable membrane-associated kinase regulator 4 [Dendrobium catenatum]